MVSIPPTYNYMEYDSWSEGQESPYVPYPTSVPHSTIPTSYSKSYAASNNLPQTSLRPNYIYPSWNMIQEEAPACMQYNNQMMIYNANMLMPGQLEAQYLSPDSFYMPTHSMDAFNQGYSHEVSSPNQLAYYSVSHTPVLYGSPQTDPYPQYRQPTWDYQSSAFCTPSSAAVSSMPSVASLSPFSDASWQDMNAQYCQVEEEEEEPLQGLGLYDCPDLTMDEMDEEFGQVDSKRFSLGKGLKLEESFELQEEEEEDDDEESDDDECDE